MRSSIVAGLLAIALASVFVIGPAAAEDAAQVQRNMEAFLKAEPDCDEFTDQCSICKVTDSQPVCSTPSIACIKKDYACTRKRGE
ncbi:hypothetical protein J5N58_17640 [Rhizobium cremeum]|uniref:hypothetical protein n=1 Tax=Rhizobium cremeum TaxID=2813827 RepID=UPI000DDCE1DE|nr:hypothetical protein [Rhizobium cremeum]MCJ7996245.1 hypothetical protein [Rhizobium cremeum]MCJ8001504.1 hypothetical protein [Rhizobium cremeum]